MHPGDSRSGSDVVLNRRSTNASRCTLSPASSYEGEKDRSREPTQDPLAPKGLTGSQHEPARLAARKRRRITRACDDCRRKKIKCDGRQPCASCADFNSECTYHRPSVRVGLTKSKDTEDLETRLHKAESLLRQFMPHLDLESSGPSALPARQKSPDARTGAHDDRQGPNVASEAPIPAEAMSERARFITVVERTGQLVEVTDTGEYVFHGLSSGAAFLGRITQQFPALFSYDSRTPFLPQPPRPFLASPMGGLPVYSANPWSQANYDFLKLPPRDLAHALCEYSFNRASCILPVVHAPSFWKMFARLYEERPQKYTHEERRFVGLLFSVTALGSMYDVDENDPTNPDHYAVAIDRGYKYYISARLYLQDITECGDMTTLQALIFIVQFSQATGNLNGCHTLIGIALRSALRMGLHRHLPHTSMTPIKDETRRRAFHAIRQIDIYLCTTLGLPLLLQDKDIDQPWPTEVDDEYITEASVLQPPPGTPSFLEAFNAHTRLMQILSKVVEHIYPPTGTENGPTDMTYVISCARIREIEQDLHRWHEQLPPTWRPGPEENIQITRAKILLRFAYGHVQLMLYRPFLQFESRHASVEGSADERHLAFATAGINVCRNIIHLGLEIQRQNVLIGPYWFITYTQFLAVLSLVLYVSHNIGKPGVSELFSDARLGKDCISRLTQRSLAADRVTTALNALFDQLPNQPKSTDPPASGRDPAPLAKDRDTQLGSRMGYATSQPARPRGFGTHQEQWSLQSATVPESSLCRNCRASPQHEPAMQSVPISGPIHNRGLWDVIDFPTEDPFAYPIMPGVSLADNNFTTVGEDTMRLPFYNLHTDMEGQFMHLQDPPQASPFLSTPAEPSESRPIHQAISRGLVDFGNGHLWEPPGPYGVPPF